MIKKSNIVLLVLFLVAGIFIIPSAVSAAGAPIYVSTHGNDSWDGLSGTYNNISGSGPKATIKNAASIVDASGTVHIASGTYRENQINITKSMNIIGANRDNTIINGTRSGVIFTITSGVHVTIKDLTLTQGGNNTYGGAINNGGVLTLDNTAFTGNNATADGGAIYNNRSLTINGSIFTGNVVYSDVNYADGGAIYNNGSLTINNSLFTGNYAMTVDPDPQHILSTDGGAIFNAGTANINNSVFSNNTITNQGGGGAIENRGVLTINGSTFSGNIAFRGGAIESTNSIVAPTLNVTNSVFTNNGANYGGAIYNSYSGFITVINNTFTNNTAYNAGGTGTFHTDPALNAGGAIYVYSGVINFNRFTGNTALSKNGNIIYSSNNVDARYNWWGSNSPNSNRVDFITSGTFLYDPWMVLTVSVSPASVQAAGVSNVTADLLHDNQGNFHDIKEGMIYYNGSACFAADSGTIADASFVDGVAKTTLNVGSASGPVNVSATVDGGTASSSVYVGIASINPTNGTIIPKNRNITVTFSETIVAGPAYNDIRITDRNGNQKQFTLTIVDNKLIISPVGDWGSGGVLNFVLPDNAVTNAGGALLTPTLTSSYAVQADTLYISKNGNNSWDGLYPVYNSTSGSGPKATIKNAVNILAENGTIHVASGNYNENQITINKNMRIIGAGRDNTIINGTNSGNIFNIQSGVYFTLATLTITQGKTAIGGAITNNGILTLNNIKVFNNTATTRAGAIYNTGSLVIDNSEFLDNSAYHIDSSTSGGAIFNTGSITVTNSIFTNNAATAPSTKPGNLIATSGGAIQNNGVLILKNSIFTNNSAYNGGAINNQGTGSLTIENCKFDGNDAGIGGAIIDHGRLNGIKNSTFINNGGGAISTQGNDVPVVVENSTFINNTTSDYGSGGAISSGGQTINIINCLFDGNYAGTYGGAIGNAVVTGVNNTLISNGIMNIINCIFTNNNGNATAGAIMNWYGTLNITNTTFNNNTSHFGGVLWNKGGKVTITNSSLTNNSAYWYGVLYNEPVGDLPVGMDSTDKGRITIINSIIKGNTAQKYAGLYNSNGVLNVTGSVISGNVAVEDYGSAIYNMFGEVYLSFNQITDNSGVYWVYSPYTSSVYADNNWWGDNGGPGNKAFIKGKTIDTWLVLTVTLEKNIMNVGGSMAVIVDMLHDNHGNLLDPANGHVMGGVLLGLSSVMADLFDSTVSLVNGLAHTFLKAINMGVGKITVTVDGQTTEHNIYVIDGTLNLDELTPDELRSLLDAFKSSWENGLKWIEDYLSSKNNNNTSGNNTPENNNTNSNNNSTNSSTNNPEDQSPSNPDGTPGNNPQPPENNPQEPNTGDNSQSTSGDSQGTDDGQTPGDTALTAAGQSGESVGDGEQNKKSYEITANVTGSGGSSQPETIVAAIIGVILLLALVGVGFYFKR